MICPGPGTYFDLVLYSVHIHILHPGLLQQKKQISLQTERKREKKRKTDGETETEKRNSKRKLQLKQTNINLFCIEHTRIFIFLLKHFENYYSEQQTFWFWKSCSSLSAWYCCGRAGRQSLESWSMGSCTHSCSVWYILQCTVQSVRRDQGISQSYLYTNIPSIQYNTEREAEHTPGNQSGLFLRPGGGEFPCIPNTI